MPNNGPKHHLDVLGGLLPLTWRDIEVPCVNMGFDGSNRLTEHTQYGVAGGYQENGYRSSTPFSFLIPFRNGIAGYEHLYPTTFRDFLDALYDPSAGTLGHPEFGPVVCKAASWNCTYDANKRDGADLQVVWKEHVDGSGLEDAERNVGVASEMVDLEMSARAIDAEWEDDFGSNPLDVLNGAAGRLQQLQTDVGNQITKIEGAISAVNEVIDVLESTTDPKAWGVANAAKNILTGLGEMAANVLPDKRKRIMLKVSDKRQPASQAAGKWDMSTDEFLALNPRVCVSGYLESGEEFFVVQEVSA